MKTAVVARSRNNVSFDKSLTMEIIFFIFTWGAELVQGMIFWASQMSWWESLGFQSFFFLNWFSKEFVEKQGLLFLTFKYQIGLHGKLCSFYLRDFLSTPLVEILLMFFSVLWCRFFWAVKTRNPSSSLKQMFKLWEVYFLSQHWKAFINRCASRCFIVCLILLVTKHLNCISVLSGVLIQEAFFTLLHTCNLDVPNLSGIRVCPQISFRRGFL